MPVRVQPALRLILYASLATATQMTDDNKQAQEDEIETLRAIWPEILVAPHKTGTRLSLAMELDLHETRQVHVVETAQDNTISDVTSTLTINHLPPISLEVVLPANYPYDAAPLVKLKSAWVLKTDQWLDDIRDELLSLWVNDCAIYAMIDTLQQCLPPSGLFIHPSKKQRNPKTTLANQIAAYDQSKNAAQFASNSFDCSICLDTRKGIACVQLQSCGHVFCVGCLQGYFSLSIHEGMVKNVHCPDPECVEARGKASKEGVEACRLPGNVSEQEIVPIVGQEMLARYRRLKEKQRVESDPSICFCPRATCQAAVEKDQEEAYAKLRTCTKCSLSFCVFCRRTWHGVTPCAMKNSDKIVERYLQADSQERSLIEQQYGAKTVQRLMEQYEEDKANDSWKNDHTMPCPGCSISVEKSHGCSHMTCQKCGVHFCYRCGEKLPSTDPYRHFSTSGSCFNKLFDYEPEAPADENLLWEAVGAILDEDD